jgi:hypothetical protein
MGTSEELSNVASKGLFGFSSSALGVAFTLTEFEQGIRVAAALVGLAIGVVTLISLLRKKKQ